MPRGMSVHLHTPSAQEVAIDLYLVWKSHQSFLTSQRTRVSSQPNPPSQSRWPSFQSQVKLQQFPQYQGKSQLFLQSQVKTHLPLQGQITLQLLPSCQVSQLSLQSLYSSRCQPFQSQHPSWPFRVSTHHGRSSRVSNCHGPPSRARLYHSDTRPVGGHSHFPSQATTSRSCPEFRTPSEPSTVVTAAPPSESSTVVAAAPSSEPSHVVTAAPPYESSLVAAALKVNDTAPAPSQATAAAPELASAEAALLLSVALWIVWAAYTTTESSEVAAPPSAPPWGDSALPWRAPVLSDPPWRASEYLSLCVCLSMLYVTDLSAPPWGDSVPPWRVPVLSASPWGASVPPWRSPVLSAPPWGASVPPWRAPVLSPPPDPPWRVSDSSDPPWWASDSSAPPWRVSAPPDPPCPALGAVCSTGSAQENVRLLLVVS
ncbi:hypothetical protein Q8A67_015545 [Cirrhinus molitorella]|uniref:Uncharacterized protein n=1 Tax=Cirrhinus molitorella TaxID=172907 RepID=A0AA88TTH9_9TELE|nr:hypothetical protein Q8A67_015545 [Cirrhinus molitorella]